MKDDNSISKIIKSKMKKMIIPIIISVLPIFGLIIMLIMLCIFVYSPFAAVGEFFDDIGQATKEFTEELGEFITFNGWSDDDKGYYTHLQEQADRYADVDGVGSLDIPLANATIHYGSLLDSNAFTEIEEETETKDDYQPEPIVETNDTRYFYRWANNELGSFNSYVRPGLLGNMVNRQLVTECKEGSWLDALGEAIVNSIKSVAYSLEQNIIDGVVSLNIANGLYNMYVYDNLGYNSFDAWYKGTIANTYTTIESFEKLFDFSYANLDLECGEGYYNSTTLRYVIDYKKYNTYLTEYFVPTYYMECRDCKWQYMTRGSEEYNKKVQDIIDEIYLLREFYTDQTIESVAGLGTITVNIDGFTPRDRPPEQANPSDDSFWWSGSGTASSLWGQCTWYVKGRVNEIMASMGSGIRIDGFPDAKNWITDPRIVGGMMFSTSTDINSPKIGAVIVWGGSGSNSFGHVAVIENIYEENGVTHVVFSHANTSMSGAVSIPGATSPPAKGTWALEDATLSSIQNRNGMNFLGYIYTIDY